MTNIKIGTLKHAITLAMILVTLSPRYCSVKAHRSNNSQGNFFSSSNNNINGRMMTSSPFHAMARLVLRGGETRSTPTSSTVSSFKPLSGADASSVGKGNSNVASIPKPVTHKKKRKKRPPSSSSSSSLSKPSTTATSSANGASSGISPRTPTTSLQQPPTVSTGTTSSGSVSVPDVTSDRDNESNPITSSDLLNSKEGSESSTTSPLSKVEPFKIRETKKMDPQDRKELESLHDKMPSLFTRDEEKQYDTYAACLAATESLRRMRDSVLKNKKGTSAVSSDDKSWKSMLKGSVGGNTTPAEKVVGKENDPTSKEAYKRACAEYVLNSSKAINALGLSVTQFNQLGREIARNRELKEKVMEQAYLYRMASTIKMDKIPLIQDPDSKQLLKSTRRRRVQMFVRSITEIEELREEQTEKLRKALNIDKLPSNVNLCDPNVLPLLSPQVRSVIEAFPLQAEEIVKKYGLNSDEFNQMLEETRGNPVFRWRVNKFRKEAEQKVGGGSGAKQDS